MHNADSAKTAAIRADMQKALRGRSDAAQDRALLLSYELVAAERADITAELETAWRAAVSAGSAEQAQLLLKLKKARAALQAAESSAASARMRTR